MIARVLLAAALLLAVRAADSKAQDAASQPTYRLGMKLDASGLGEPKAYNSQGVSTAESAGPRRKSPLLAGGLSLLLPGAGEAYAESYLPAAAFLAAEAAAWYFRVDYLNKGDNQTALFESYADANWSAVKYAEWLNENARSLPGGENTTPIEILPDPENRYKPWERVNWDQLNAVEMSIHPFSHRLPRHGDQQYFELIGKYDQYSFGWTDKNDGYYRDISPMFRMYSDMRGKANDFFNSADTFLNLVLLNHFLSAVDAAWAAARFNSAVSMESRVYLRRLPTGETELEPEAVFRIRL